MTANLQAKLDRMKAGGATDEEIDRMRVFQIGRLKVDTYLKHARVLGAVGKMLMDMQLIDVNPFALCVSGDYPRAAAQSGLAHRRPVDPRRSPAALRRQHEPRRCAPPYERRTRGAVCERPAVSRQLLRLEPPDAEQRLVAVLRGVTWDDSSQSAELYDGFIAAAVAEAITENAAWYCWHASRRKAMLEACWEKTGSFVHQQIIWVKDRGVLTRSY